MDVASWIAIAIAVIAAIGVVTAQWVARIGEPRRLNLLKTLNEVIDGYESDEEGRRALLMARNDLGLRVGLDLRLPPLHLRVLGAVVYVVAPSLLFLIVCLFVAFPTEFSAAMADGWVYIPMAVVLGVALLAGVTYVLLADRWRSRLMTARESVRGR